MARPPDPRGLSTRALATLSTGHLATDFASGSVPALLPFLVDEFDLSYAAAGAVMLVWAIASSVVQPLFGLWSDRRGAIWLLPGGLVLAGVGIGLAPLAPSYWLLLGCVGISGLGVAAYHPEGSKFAAYASGDRRASGMALFSIGGNLGYATGPIAATALVLGLGLGGGFLLAVPPLLAAAGLLALTPFLLSFAPTDGSHASLHAGRDRPRAMTLLLAVAGFRSLAWFGLISFVPLYEVAQGHSEAYGNRLLALMLLAGGIGTIAAGPVADRIGLRPVLVASVAATGPLIAVYLLAGGVVGAIALAGVGVCVTGTFGVTMVMAQEYLPSRIGLASGLSIGLSIGLGGVAAVALGALADRIDLDRALWVCAGAALVALALAVRLPSSAPGRRVELDFVVP
ncbi:MAG TPA: MFS transporter [Gaiellaceae bacterium]|nr:MFS transporter [Gaiellaceae bacterium]